MADRTQLHVGNKAFAVPTLTKRVFEAAMGFALTAAAILTVLTLNNLLTGRTGWYGGYTRWMKFIQQTDILGTMILTAVVTVAFVYWYRGKARR
ncbi:MAG: hypothetical protein AAGJ53_07020 [Pseudomonadota bacterium]